MNVLILALHGAITPHCEAEFEFAQIHLDKGDQVTFSYCDGALLACDCNPSHDFVACKACISKRLAGLPLLAQKISVRSFLEFSPTIHDEIKTLRTEFSNPDELKRYRIDNFDIGYAVLSSIISDDRDPMPDVVRKAKLVRNFMIAALTVYRSVQQYLDEHPTDRVYIHNGRFAPVRAALRACQSRNVDFVVHEFGCDLQHYSATENALPHELRVTYQRIVQCWEEGANDSHRDEIGAKFFMDRIRGVTPNWYSFLEQQQEGTLPTGWEATKRNIAIFSSSEDEFEGIDEEWDKTLYPSQLEGVKAIADSFAGLPNFHFYFRLHPNLRRVTNSYTQQLRTLRAPNLTVLQPESSDSTYALMRNADKIITFGSTMGIEATFWGKPSILAGRSWYERLNGTYNPKTHSELVALLQSDLPPMDKKGALIYGYYMSTFGQPYKYFRATGIRNGEFKGHQLKALPPWRYLGKIQRGFRIRQWLNTPYILFTHKKITGKWT